MAIYDKDSKKYLSICKLGTGFNLVFLTEMSQNLNHYIATRIPQDYILPNKIRPNIFFKPKVVWEVGYDSFTESFNYTLLKNEITEEYGISLRFPRFIRVREDKQVTDCTDLESLRTLYLNS